MEALLTEENTNLKAHVNSFSKEVTQLTKDNAQLKEKASLVIDLERQLQDLDTDLQKEKELNKALTDASEDAFKEQYYLERERSETLVKQLRQMETECKTSSDNELHLTD